MEKSDYINIIVDNITVYGIKLPSELQADKLYDYLRKFDGEILNRIAGFNKNFLEHFLIISMGKGQKELNETIKKMEKISLMIGPTGNLHYLTNDQIEFVLSKVDSLNLNEISEEKINTIADEQLEKQFGAGQYNVLTALENQLASAEFYLMEQGYSRQEIQEKLEEVRRNPSKLDTLFTLPGKEIYNLPPELQQGNLTSSRGRESANEQETTIDTSQETQNAINQHVQSIQQDIGEERAQKVDEILQQIKEHVKDDITENYEKVFRQMHPERLNLAYKMLKETKRKSKRMSLYLEWFFCSHLIENIEVKVEHWQQSSRASQSAAGVYTAGISFSRYDQIVRRFDDGKLAKVINISRKILQNPTKKAIQKLGQDLIAETGFDEHLYFTE